MRKTQGFAFFEVRLDAVGIDLGLDMVLGKDLDDVGSLGCLIGAHRDKTILFGLLEIRRTGHFGNNDPAAGIPQAQRLASALDAVANDGDRFVF